MRLTTAERHQLNSMIETQTFFGIPLNEITHEVLDEIDQQGARTLYIVASMLGWEARDKDDTYPYEAEEYLKRFRLSPQKHKK